MRFSPLVLSVVLGLVCHPGFAGKDKKESCPPSVANTGLSDKLARLGVQGANHQFTLALLKELTSEQYVAGKSLVFSPFSISSALSMVRAGTTGVCASQIDHTLGFDASNGGLSLDDILLGNQLITADVAASGAGGTEVKVSNALWLARQYGVNPSYRKMLETYFGALVESVDFGTPAALARINGQISKDTGGMINPFLKETSKSDASLLTNAVYLNGTWEIPFDIANTSNAEFAVSDGSKIPIKMMSRTGSMNFVQQPTYNGVRLALAGGKLFVDLVLPKKPLDTFVDELSGSQLSDIGRLFAQNNKNKVASKVQLRLPRLKLGFSTDLIPNLANLGMRKPFNRSAGPDFAGMLTGENGAALKDLFISLVQHTAKLELDEKGVKAAAATGVGMTRSISMPELLTFDRPFLLLISDEDGNTTFAASVANPG